MVMVQRWCLDPANTIVWPNQLCQKTTISPIIVIVRESDKIHQKARQTIVHYTLPCSQIYSMAISSTAEKLLSSYSIHPSHHYPTKTNLPFRSTPQRKNWAKKTAQQEIIANTTNTCMWIRSCISSSQYFSLGLGLGLDLSFWFFFVWEWVPQTRFKG